MRLKTLIFLALFYCPGAMAQTGTEPAQPSTAEQKEIQGPPWPPPQEILEKWRRASVSIGLLQSEGGRRQYRTIGTGLVVSIDDRRACLLTARHVLFDRQKNYAPPNVRLRFSSAAPSDEAGRGTILALTENGRPAWKSLPDGSDLAVVPLARSAASFDADGVSLADFEPAGDNVFQGAPVTILGFPAIESEEMLIYPLARSGMIAWTNPNDRLGAPFVVDSNIVPGSSGGPVFRRQSGHEKYGPPGEIRGLSLVGIVIKDAGRKSASQSAGDLSSAYAEVMNMAGIGIVEPVSKARQLLERLCAAPLVQNPQQNRQ